MKGKSRKVGIGWEPRALLTRDTRVNEHKHDRMSLNSAVFKNGLPRSTCGVPPLSPFVDLITWKSAGITSSPILTRIFSAIPTTDTTLALAVVNISFVFLRGPNFKNL
ncbi:hypothetical protein PIB30_093967 [Stylosanthes scabra]|uniref:Uncharacterized protein n=1 Tax=Stylosanthes scabra TaxID=79078 RepID=A0ABU6TUT5_9FABA|nr:hypothetical protein [Stylosanthes scabra]